MIDECVLTAEAYATLCDDALATLLIIIFPLDHHHHPRAVMLRMQTEPNSSHMQESLSIVAHLESVCPHPLQIYLNYAIIHIHV